MPADLAPALADPLDAHARDALDADGYLLLRAAIPADWIAPIRAAFDAGVLASDEWPVPRQASWRHAQVDLDAHVQRVCRLPMLLAAVRHLLGAPFFLSQVEGREPREGNPPQPLHRDAAHCPGELVAALIWLDPYGAANGATQVVPGSHRTTDDDDGCPAHTLTGEAGDVLVFDPNLRHGATTNHDGTRRRALLVSFALATSRARYAPTAALRGVRMESSETFA